MIHHRLPRVGGVEFSGTGAGSGTGNVASSSPDCCRGTGEPHEEQKAASLVSALPHWPQ